jgi:hypothetical protein
MSSLLITEAGLSALLWLRNRNSDGVFDRNQVLVAGGEKAPVMRGTWTKLEKVGAVEFYHDRRRVRVTDFGKLVNMKGVRESEARFADEDA